MRFKEQFDPARWRALQLAPFLILSGISGRYRGFDLEEMAAFRLWLDDASRQPGSLNREVLASVSSDLDELALGFARYEGTIVSGLVAAADALLGLPQGEADAFRDALIRVLGAGLARARGPYGLHPTTESEQMLMMLDEFLRPGVVIGASTSRHA